MIAQNLSRLKVQKSSLRLTSYAGLPLLSELAHQAGTVKRLDSISGLWERTGSYRTSDYVMGLAMTVIAGGEGLDDTRLLRKDPGIERLVFPSLPAANSFGRFLRRFTHRTLHRLGEVATDLALKNIHGHKLLTLDVDSTVVESDKDGAKMTYKQVTGYNPVLAWLAEPDVFLAGVFRDGNAAPQSHILSLLRHCCKRLPKGIPLRLRSDSAGYRLDVIDFCHRHGIAFAIGIDLDPAVREAIDKIPEKHWRIMVRDKETYLFAETIHVPGGGNNAYDLPAFRLIVTRKVTGQLDLFEDPIKTRAIISSLPEAMKTEEVLEFYNGRGRMEKAIGELKHGFGLDRLPCGDLFANAAFFQVLLVAYNLVQAFKRFALPEAWKTFCIKNLRFRLLCQAALVVRHAGQTALKLAREFAFYDVFEKARWAVLAPGLS